MPKTTQVTNVLDLLVLKMFNPKASERLITAFKEGKKIEKVETLFDDPGSDNVKFMLEGEEICTVQGY